MDFLMEGFQAGGELLPHASLCEERTPSTSRPTAKLCGYLQVIPPGDEREREPRKARLIQPVATAQSFLPLDVHYLLISP